MAVRQLSPRPSLRGAVATSPLPAPGRHGGDGARVARSLGLDPGEVVDLSASLNPLAPALTRLARHRLDSLGRYPDGDAATRELAAAIGVADDRVLLTNGGSEAIALVAAELGGWCEDPEFSLHPRGPRSVGPRWRSNPHNPTGILAPGDDVAGVWDEAFFAMATGRWTRGDPGSVVVGSLTKLFACPGLRLGYVLADPELVWTLRRRQPEWSVNGLAVGLLPDLLEVADLRGWSDGIAELRAALTSLLASHGLEPLPSQANFVLCRRAPGLRERLLPQGVVVRDCTSFGLVDHARVAVPDRGGLTRLAHALDRSAP